MLGAGLIALVLQTAILYLIARHRRLRKAEAITKVANAPNIVPQILRRDLARSMLLRRGREKIDFTPDIIYMHEMRTSSALEELERIARAQLKLEKARRELDYIPEGKGKQLSFKLEAGNLEIKFVDGQLQVKTLDKTEGTQSDRPSVFVNNAIDFDKRSKLH